MRNRKLVTLALSATALAGAVLAAPAATAADTQVTFTLTGGDLIVTAPSGLPDAVELSGSARLSLTPTAVSGQLGTTTVTDNRGGLLHSLTVRMAADHFKQYRRDAQGALVLDADEKPIVDAVIDKSNARGYSGAALSESLTSLAIPTLVPVSIGGTGGGIIVTTATFLGNASLSYNPTVSVTIPTDAPAGTYNGVITQTAS